MICFLSYSLLINHNFNHSIIYLFKLNLLQLMKEEDEDYGAELDAIEEKTEKKIEKKQTSMFA